MRRLTLAEFIKKARKVHGNRYLYDKTVYAGATRPIVLECLEHGEFRQVADAHLAGKGCPSCRAGKAAETRRLKTPEFVQLALEVHGALYDYADVVCRGVSQPVTIGCPLHGRFEQRPRLHLKGHGCPRCGIARRAFQNLHSLEDFVRQARRAHRDAYLYHETVYTGAQAVVNIRCRQHGLFSQQATSHLSGHGCPVCYRERAGDSQRHTPASLAARGGEVHAGKYTYPEQSSGYRNEFDAIEIICPKHGAFKQVAKRHLSGDGCPVCAGSASKGEAELAAWVLQLCPDAVSRTRTIIPPCELDIYVPSAKIAIEYNGMYWHSCDPLTASGRDLKDQQKRLDCLAKGIDLFVVWEWDWQRHRSVIEHWLRHKLGKASRLCGARQAELGLPSTAEAQEFYRCYHLQGACQSPVASVGLRFRGQWVALATFSKSPERGVVYPAGEFYFARLALAGSVPGAASRLFKELVKLTSAQRVHAHSDNSYADGGVKKQLGFAVVGQLPPRYRLWHPHYGLRHRIFWQKSNMLKRLSELEIEPPFDLNARTTYALHALCGCRHVWDLGKTQWEWTANPVL